MRSSRHARPLTQRGIDMGQPTRVRRVTISLPVELLARLREKKEFNWSAVCREALAAALDGQEHVAMEAVRLLEENRRLKGLIKRIQSLTKELT